MTLKYQSDWRTVYREVVYDPYNAAPVIYNENEFTPWSTYFALYAVDRNLWSFYILISNEGNLVNVFTSAFTLCTSETRK